MSEAEGYATRLYHRRRSSDPFLYAQASLSPIHHRSSGTFAISLQALKRLQKHHASSQCQTLSFPPLRVRSAAGSARPKRNHGRAGGAAGPRGCEASPGSAVRISGRQALLGRRAGSLLEQLTACDPAGKGTSSLCSSTLKDDFGSHARAPQTATPLNVMSRTLRASRPVNPLYSFPNIFCMHLVNKLYILLISALHGAREGEETSCSTIAIARSNVLRSALAAP